MSPAKIKILLFHHYSPEQYLDEEGRDVSNTLKELFHSGFLKVFKAEHYKLTEKGKVFVNALITLPDPVEQITWVIPRMKE